MKISVIHFDFSVSRFPYLWDDKFYVISELRQLLTENSSENCSNIKRITACSCLHLSLKIHQYRGHKKTVLYFVFLVVLESRFQLFLSKLECRAFDIDFGAIQ